MSTRGRYQTVPYQKGTAPSVTTIVGLLNKPGLPWGAAAETALFAIHHQDEWIDLAPDEAYERLRKHHRGVWNDKASRGTVVHDLASMWAKGEAVECPEDCLPYLDALERFYDEQQPSWLHTERSVIYSTPGLDYGGTFDWIADLADGRRVLGDWKTGKRYPIEATLQLAGYRFAEGIGVYSALGGLESIEPMVEVDAAAIVYLHDDGTYELVDVPADQNAHRVFLALRAVYGWNQEMAAWEKAHPEPERQAVAS